MSMPVRAALRDHRLAGVGGGRLRLGKQTPSTAAKHTIGPDFGAHVGRYLAGHLASEVLRVWGDSSSAGKW